MPEKSLFNHEALANPGLSNDNEQKKPIDEVDKNDSDKQKDKNAHSHTAQAQHGMRNNHEQDKPEDETEFNQNYHCINNEHDDDDDGGNEDKDKVEDEDQGEDEDEDKGEDEDEDEVEYEDRGEDEDEDEDQDEEEEDEDEDKGEDEDEDEVEYEDRGEDEDEDEDQDEEEEDDENQDEYITVNLSNVRKEFQCPICLGIIRKTRTVMHCLHRFCRECIDKSMRTGNNECPVCRTHCASRRSLRDDPNYDTLISLLYPDIDKEEEEETTLQENEMILNNQIQASIAETRQRQTEAVSRKRRCGNSKNAGELQVSNYNDDDAGMGSSSGVEMTETMPKEGEEQEAQFLLESSTTDAYMNRETLSSGINAGSNRLSRLIDHLRNSNANDDELEFHFMLVSLDEQMIPSLQEPYICCKPTVSVKILSKYVALKTGLQADQVELCLVKEPPANIIGGERIVDLKLEEDKLRVLRDEETLAELYTHQNVIRGHMLLAYKMK